MPTRPWEYTNKRAEDLRRRSAFRRQAATAGFTRLAGDSLRQRGIDPASIPALNSGRATDTSGPGTEGALFSRVVKRLTALGLSPEEATKRARGSIDARTRRSAAGVAEPVDTRTPDLRLAQQRREQPVQVAPLPDPAPVGGIPLERFDEETQFLITKFRSDLASEGFEPWMIDTQLQGQIRLGALLGEEREKAESAVPAPPAVLTEAQNKTLLQINEKALARLDEEMGDLLDKAQPQRGLFSKIMGVALTPLSPLATVIGALEKSPLGGPFARPPEFEGKSVAEKGAELSRPVAKEVLPIVAKPFEAGEIAFEEVTGIRSRGVSGAIQGDIAEDILTEVINPAFIVLVAPQAMVATRGLSGLKLAAQIADNLVGTGVSGPLARATLRGLTNLGRGGLAAARSLPRVVLETPIIQDAIRTLRESPEAGGVVLGRTSRERAILLTKESLELMPGRMLGEVAGLLGTPIGKTKAKTIEGIRSIQAKEAPGLRTVLKKVSKEQEAALKAGVTQAATPVRPEAVGRRLDIVESGLEASQAQARAAQTREFERGVMRAVTPDKPKATVPLKPFERDQTGDALQRLSEAPDNPVPLRSRRDLPELSQFDDQLESALRFRDQVRESLKFNRSAAKAGIVSPGRVPEAEKLLLEANKQLKNSRAILREAKVRALRESVMGLVRDSGGSEASAGIIGRFFDGSVSMVPLEDSLLTAAAWRQRIARGVATVKGRIAGSVGILADQRTALLEALRLQTADEVDDIFRNVQRLLTKESGDITYIGPTRFAEMAEGEYKLYHIVQHPEWFKGKSTKLDGLLVDSQLAMRGRLEQARALGYPIEALDGAYLQQLWDIPRSPLETPILRAKGKVSIAKQRWFDDYFEGLTKGGKPLDLTVEELMQHSSVLLDEAIADAFLRQEVLRRFGTRTAKVPALKGARKFGHPLYQGWSAPSAVTNSIDQLYNPVGLTARGVGNVAATMKNTAFGLVDVAVGGVQFPLSIAHGGLQIGVGTLNRSLEALGLPFVHVALQDPNVVSRTVQYAEDTLHAGIGPSSVRLSTGTVIKYIPIVGKYIDKPLAATIDFMARMQFGHALSLVRRRMYEGNLIAAKFVGQDITNPAVRKFWAESANAQTGAARGAQTPGRRGAETFLLTSAPMTRANLAVYGQIAQGLTVGGRMHKLRTALVLTNLAAYTYGMQYLINSVFGDGPQEWIPGKPDWATIRVGGTTVPLMPQRTLLRAIDKSLTIIMEGVDGEGWRPEDIALAWSQVVIGKSSPIVQTLLGPVFGIGFEPETGRFQTGGLPGAKGTLSVKGRLLAIPPTPPIAEQAVFQERDVASLVLAGVGFNPYPTSTNKLLREEWLAGGAHKKDGVAQDFNDEVDWIVADSHPELSVEFSPMVAASNASSLKWGSLSSLRRDRIEQFRAQEEVQSGLERDAEEFLAGSDVGRTLMNDWLDHQAGMSSVIAFSILDETREPETPEGKALRAWGEVQPDDEKYRDPITRDVDRDAYRADKEAAFEAIREVYPELAEALEARTRAVSPNLVQVEPDIIEALGSLSDYRKIDRWFGIDKETENQVESIHRMVEDKRDELALQGFIEVSSGDVYKLLAQDRPDIPKSVWQSAWTVRPGADTNYRNPDADQFLISNEGTLRRFFPNLYRRDLLVAIGLGGEVRSAGNRQLAPALRARLGLNR